MYRMLLILTLVACSEGLLCGRHKEHGARWKLHHNHRSWRHKYLPSKRINDIDLPSKKIDDKDLPSKRVDDFATITQKFIDATIAISTLCEANNNIVLETFGNINYILSYELPGYQKANIKVSTTHRVLEVVATKESDGKTILFRDMRILPDILKYDGALWTYAQETLRIEIPYDVPLGMKNIKYCTAVNKNRLEVPDMSTPSMDMRYGDLQPKVY